MNTQTEELRISKAIETARELLESSVEISTRNERQRLARMGGLLEDSEARSLIFCLTDEVLRFTSSKPAARRFFTLVGEHSTKGFGALDSTLLRLGARFAMIAPKVVMPLVARRIKLETKGMVISADDPAFSRYLSQRRSEGAHLNVNLLGEAILSDREADVRLQEVCKRIERPDVNYISVKISAIVANLDAMAFDESVEWICDRLRIIYRLAASAKPPTFINLDMEEYRDLELTLQSFMKVLAEPEFLSLDAGIVLQAYLPDSHDALERLGTWACSRRANGGGTVKVRLVKGANLAMETVEAESHCWVSAPYATKAEVDASYKRLLESALRDEWAEALRIGVASHNLFDLAWVLVVARETGSMSRIDIEMLEGMAPAQGRALLKSGIPLLMYSPTVSNDDFAASIAYLTRRLDENTQDDNFLRALFTLEPNSVEFDNQADRFRESVLRRNEISTSRKRKGKHVVTSTGFANEPDGDPTDSQFRSAVKKAIDQYSYSDVPRCESVHQIDEVVNGLHTSFSSHNEQESTRRRVWLLNAADIMSRRRPETIGLLAHSVGKTVREADPEISEAIDFCRFYAQVGMSSLDSAIDAGCDVNPRGVVLVVGPWNFPYAIPVGGVAAALAAGNSVLLKPAPEAVHVGKWIVDQFHEAGVPDDVLQLIVCSDNEVGQHLITHDKVDTVVLTGSLETAEMFLRWKPSLQLFAETSGKNSLVITASADIDQAIADLVRSAFGHAGQKCSAASLGIIDASLYDDPKFMSRLAEAVKSIRVQPAVNFASMMGPVITPPSGSLLRALTTLEEGERWLVEPTMVNGDPRMWTPGVRVGVGEGSWFHLTECFGPVLGLVRSESLDESIRIQNGTKYGLTGGIHSLDKNEIDTWLAGVEIGNVYINRHITGAIVQRQPFGGWKKSTVGGGAKAGGQDYVIQFARILGGEDQPEVVRERFRSEWAFRNRGDFDPTGLESEANILRYVPLRCISVRHDGSNQTLLDILRMISDVTGVAVQYSDSRLESEEEFLVVASQSDKVRLLTNLSDLSRSRLHEMGVPVVSDQPVLVPQIELRHWAKEQSISRMLHRHGRLIRPKMCQDLNAELSAKSQSALGGQQQEEGEQHVNNH